MSDVVNPMPGMSVSIRVEGSGLPGGGTTGDVLTKTETGAEWKTSKQDIPTTVPQVQSAQVGQTVVVKAVDENGKPTEWEAKDVSGGSAGGGLPGIVVNFTLDGQECTSDISLEEAMTMFDDGQPIWIKSNDPRMPVVQMTYCAGSSDSKFEGLYGVVPTHTLDGALMFKDVSWTYSHGNEILICINSAFTNEGLVQGDNFGGIVTRP